MADAAEQVCPLCGQRALREVRGFSGLRRVTSDARPWPAGGQLTECAHCGAVEKPVNDAFLREVQSIYDSYQLYYQGSGGEQRIFNGQDSSPRSELLLNFFFDATDNGADSKSRRWLDFGCGTGHLLHSLSVLRPSWRLAGADLGERNRRRIETIPTVERYYAGGLDGVDGLFDAVSLSHVLEHVPEPASLLDGIRRRLVPGGDLLIAVPDWQANPFDLLVADHCHHFQLGQLRELIGRSGFNVVEASDRAIAKELLVVARASDKAPREAALEDVGQAGQPARAVRWLAHLVEWAERAAEPRPTGVFGTALAATWLDDSVSQPFDFFVDENPDRIGTEHRGRPVLAPAEVSADGVVYIPMPPEIAGSVARRLNLGNRPQFLAPPSLPL